jgi:hypothetical protein
LREAADCLRYLHGHAPPIVHRDIKPGNVILRPDGSYCLVDFGSVRDRLKPEGGSTVVGTFGFMAPEQFQGRAGPGSDVYAVGATALSLVTGREPEDLPHKGLSIDVEGALRGQVDRRLIAALRSMLEPDPDRRAASIDAALRSSGLLSPTEPKAERAAAASAADAVKRARRARFEAEAERDAWWSDEHARHQGKAARRREREARLQAEREERRAQKFARKAERRARRHGQRSWHRPGPPVPPGRVLGVVVLAALGVASAATFALFQVLLPLLFTLLHAPERRQRLFEIGQAGQRGLSRAREHVRYQFLGGPIPSELAAFLEHEAAPGQRPSAAAAARPSAAPRTRVSIDAEAEELEVEAGEESKHARR